MEPDTAQKSKAMDEISAARKDRKYFELWMEWHDEADPELRKQRWREVMEYWAKRRLKLGFKDKEE